MAQMIALSTRQQFTVSLRMQEAVRLLQMSAAEFSREIEQALAENPFLEEAEPGDDEVNEPSIDASDLAAEPQSFAADEPPEASVPEDPFDTWASYRSARKHDGDDDSHDLGEWAGEPESLRSHLRSQLNATQADARIRSAAEVVIDMLDDDGYLRQDLNDAASMAGVNPPLSAGELAAGHALVRGLDPSGIAATDLVDCLALQLSQMTDGDERIRDIATRIARDHLELLAHHGHDALARALGCDLADVQAAHTLIRRLDPYPGRQLLPLESNYIVPDVSVVRHGDRLVAVLNPALFPRLRLNQMYVGLMRSARAGHSAVAGQLQDARWLLRNAEQRFNTIQRVADAILVRQRAFFDHGDIGLKPLVLRDLAEELGMHESTVSRATVRKYMATPRGIFEFKHFFSAQLPTSAGGTCSSTAVQALIKEMISSEPANEPWSDVDLARMLRDKGIRVARRTVTKYRTQLRLLPAELRRH